MASQKTILLMVAGVIGLGTLVLVHDLMKPEPVQQQALQAPPPVQTVEIAAAAHDLPTGTILKEADLKWVTWPIDADASALFVKSRTSLSAIAGAVVREGLRANEPIVSARVAHPHDQGFLAAVLTPGMRAMSIALSPTAEVAGFIFPGDRVDVIMAHAFSRKEVPSLSDRHISETILRNVRVLALDQRSDNQATDPKLSQIGTLEVDDKEAQKLALAVELKGTLSLVLRSLASDEQGIEIQNGPTWDSDVSPTYPGAGGNDDLMQKVQVMRGGATTENSFERHR